MTAHARTIVIAGAVSIASHAIVAAAQASAQDTPRNTAPQSRAIKPEPAMPTAAPQPLAVASGAPSTLLGPLVSTGAARPSLLRRSFDGGLERLQLDPAEAALDLIPLDDDARQRALALLDKRAAILDGIVERNLAMLTEANTAAQSGQFFRLLQIASELHRQFVGEAGDEPLADQLAAVLPAHDAGALRDLVREYWGAVVRDEGGDDAGRIEAFVIKRRAALGGFAKEIERATQRVTADATNASDHWDAMLAALNLTPAQEREIRAMGREFYIGAGLTPTKQDTADFLIRVYHKLDADQQERFFRIVMSAE